MVSCPRIDGKLEVKSGAMTWKAPVKPGEYTLFVHTEGSSLANVKGHNLLGELYVLPISESLPLRLATFGKLLLEGVPFYKAKVLFQKDKTFCGKILRLDRDD